MVRITEELLRKKAEHHDGVLADLEEVSLHQLEIERIEGLGGCRKLRILYLQNNVIGRIEGLHHLKELRYLNLTLNNITRVEGLSSCEFLCKLDLTANFIGPAGLRASVDHLTGLRHLGELYLLGNPAAARWQAGYRDYVVARLPQLRCVDGVDVTRSERLAATRRLPELSDELARLAAAEEEAAAAAAVAAAAETAGRGTGAGAEDDGDAEPSEWTPAARLAAARKTAVQKEAEAARKRAMEPAARDADAEQAAAVAAARAREAAAAAAAAAGGGATVAAADPPIRQVNEGRWDFALEEAAATASGGSGYALRLGLSRHTDPSLVDVDVHPSWVSVVVKGQVFRLLWPEEVAASAAVCQRSQTSGELLVTVPAAVQRAGGRRAAGLSAIGAAQSPHSQARSQQRPAAGAATGQQAAAPVGGAAPPSSAAAGTTTARRAPRKLADELLDLQLGTAGGGGGSGGAVDIHNIVSKSSRGGAAAVAAGATKPLTSATSTVPSGSDSGTAAAAGEPHARFQPAHAGSDDLPDDLPPLE